MKNGRNESAYSIPNVEISNIKKGKEFEYFIAKVSSDGLRWSKRTDGILSVSKYLKKDQHFISTHLNPQSAVT